MEDKYLQYVQQSFQKATDLTKAAHYQQAIEVLEGAALVFQEEKKWKYYLQSLNEIGKNYNYLVDAEKAITVLKIALEIAKSYCLQNTYYPIATFNSLGYAYGLQNKLKEEMTAYQSALSVEVTEESPAQKKALALTYSNIGSVHVQQKKYGTAIKFHQKALKFHLEVNKKKSNDLAICYNNLGACYSSLGDHAQALPHFQKTLYNWLEVLPEGHPHLVYAYNNIASCYHFKKQYESAILQFEKAYAITSKHFVTNDNLNATILSNLGNCYNALQQFDKAIDYYGQSIDIQTKKNSAISVLSVIVYDNYCNLGNCYATQQKYDTAFHYFEIAKKGYQEIFGDKHPKLAEVLNLCGNTHLQKGAEKEAINHLHQSLQVLLPDFQAENIYQYPPVHTDYFSKKLLFAINRKALSFYGLYQKNPNDSTKELYAAFEGYQRLDEFIEVKRQQYKGYDSKLFLGEELVIVYEKAIEVAIEVGKLQKTKSNSDSLKNLQIAFNFAEKSKAVLLMSDLKEAEAMANIPLEIREQEENIKNKLLQLEKKIDEAKAKKELDTVRELESQHFDLQQEYLQLIEQLEKKYPDYHQLKYSTQTATVQTLQQFLKEKEKQAVSSKGNSILLSYYIGEQFIFIFEITSNNYQVHQIAKPSNFEDLVMDFLDAINAVDIDDFVEIAEELYALLLKPLQLEKYFIEGETTPKLTILRHGVLNYLPYDALLLLAENQDFEEKSLLWRGLGGGFNLPYLIRFFEVAYHYSATLLLHQAAKRAKSIFLEDSFLGIAPVSFNGKEQADVALVSRGGKTKILRSNREGEKALSNLPSTENEVKAVFELFQSRELEAKIFLYGAASKQNLFLEAPKHKYILISTHGMTHESNSKLTGIYLAKNDVSENSYLQNDFLLYTSETYHLHLQADLVVLSSCSSGVGELYSAEGMMALQRGFLYAGANNIIFTQFDIPDESSSTLVKKLFEYVLEGDNYAAALRKAKMDLLVLEDYTPQDWAGFLLIGE
ncbi:MAG: tetratricopeptide repeat protein [Chitinophagales bacterium]